MLFKISFILLVSLSLSLATPPLRSEVMFRPAQLIELLSEQSSFLKLADGLTVSASESDYLNEFAQALADHNGDAISFIDSYKQSKYSKSILTFGFKLRGNTKIRTILFNDSTEVVDHMTGFLDFRHHNSKISMKAREIRKMIKAGQCPLNENYKPQDCKWTRVPGSLSVSSPNFSKNLPIRNLRDILPIMTLYDDFLESQIKLMDSNGNIPLGWIPVQLDMNFEHFDLKIESTDSYPFPLRVDPGTPRNEILELIDNHHREIIENTTLEDALQLTKIINTYGFGISLDSNDDITIVYSFGSQGNAVPRNKNLRARLNDYSYVTSRGTKLNFNPYDFEKNTLAGMQRRNNQLVIDSVNLNRLNQGLKPLRQAEPRLYELAQKEADRMILSGKLSEPDLKSLNKNAILVATSVVGENSIKEFVFNVNDNVAGTIGCFDNFSNQRSKIYNYFDLSGNICSKSVGDNWSKFDSFGSGVAYNAEGDLISVFVLTESD